MSTDVSGVTKFFPSAQNGFATTLASTISSGATTVPLNSVAGYTNGDTAVFVIEPTSSTAKQTFTGVIDTAGVQVTGVVWTAGTNQSHSGGVTVVDYASATHMSMVTKGILVAHNQDGTHKSGATYLLPTVASFANANHDHTNSAGGGAIGTGAVSAAALATNAIALGYAQITANFSTASTTVVQVTGLTTTVTIPAGGRKVKITAFTAALYNSTAANATQMTIWDGVVGSGTQLSRTTGIEGGSSSSGGIAVAIVTPAAGSKTYNVGLIAVTSGTATVEAAATYPAFILVEVI